MKKLFLLALVSVTSVLLWAQQGAKKPVTNAAPASVLKTLNDSASYAIGYSLASFYKQQGVSNLNTSLVTKAINDVLGNKPALCDDYTANSIVTSYLNKLQDAKSKPTIESGKEFLEKNKTG